MRKTIDLLQKQLATYDRIKAQGNPRVIKLATRSLSHTFNTIRAAGADPHEILNDLGYGRLS